MVEEPSGIQDSWNQTLSTAMPVIALGVALLHAVHVVVHSQFWNSNPIEAAFYADLIVLLTFSILALFLWLRPLASLWAQTVFGLIVSALFVKIAYHKLFEEYQSQTSWLILFVLLGAVLLSRRPFFGFLGFITGLAVLVELNTQSFNEPASSRAMVMLAAAVGSMVVFRIRRGQQLRLHKLSQRDQYLTLKLKSSEERFRLLSKHTVDVVWTINAKGIFTFMSSAMENWLGTPAEAFVGKPMSSKFITEPTLKKTQEQFARAYAGEFDKILVEAEHIRTDGSTLWCEINGTVVRDSAGEVEIVYGTTRDISERRAAATALRESEERFRLISENSGDIVYVYDAAGYITYVSPSIVNIVGFTPQERIGLSFSDLGMSAASNAKAREIYESFVAGSIDSAVFEVEQELKQGDWIWAELHALARRSHIGSLEAIHVTVRDISERKRTSELLDRQRARLTQRTTQLTELNQQLDNFSAAISHDLQAPLRRIQRRLLKTQEAPAERGSSDENIQAAMREANEMSGLVEHLLSISRSDKQTIKRTCVDFGQLVRRVVNNCCIDSGRDCQIEAPEIAIAFAYADAQLLELVLSNLVNNAFKFTPAEVELSLFFVIEEFEGEKVYSCTDNGPGFGKGSLDTLFASFQRGDNQGGVPGHGIGLATVSNIIAHHGGRIWAENLPEGGAAVRFTLGGEDIGEGEERGN